MECYTECPSASGLVPRPARVVAGVGVSHLPTPRTPGRHKEPPWQAVATGVCCSAGCVDSRGQLWTAMDSHGRVPPGDPTHGVFGFSQSAIAGSAGGFVLRNDVCLPNLSLREIPRLPVGCSDPAVAGLGQAEVRGQELHQGRHAVASSAGPWASAGRWMGSRWGTWSQALCSGTRMAPALAVPAVPHGCPRMVFLVPSWLAHGQCVEVLLVCVRTPRPAALPGLSLGPNSFVWNIEAE